MWMSKMRIRWIEIETKMIKREAAVRGGLADYIDMYHHSWLLCF